MKREKFYLLIFILTFFFAISFLAIKSYATVCCCYPDNNGNCTRCYTFSGSSCPDSSLCDQTSGGCPCSSDSDCGSCGSGECQGYNKCENGVCNKDICNSDGKSCTYTCPPDNCIGYKWCDYPYSVTGTCSGGICKGTCDCQSLTCSKDKCNAPCVPGDSQSCDYCSGNIHCTGTKSCTNDCTWGDCVASSCKCEVGYCGVTDASQCCPSGTYYKKNPWSGKDACCSSSTDCVDYYGNCVSSGSWGNGDNSGPSDYCSYGTWKLGRCIATTTSGQCLPPVYTTNTIGCIYFSYECSPNDFRVVGAVGCVSDNECQGYDPTTHTKYVCECPSPNSCSIIGNSYTCKPKPLCSSNSDCDSGWCCNAHPALPADCKQPTGSCVAKGKIICNNQYICDPPEGFVNSSNEKTNTQANKKLTLLDLLINPFYYFFIR